METDDLKIEKPVHIFDILDSQREQEKDDDMAIGIQDDPMFESFGYLGNLNQANDGQFEEFRYKKFCLPSDEEINFLTRRLVAEQLNVLRKVVSFCKDVIRSWKNHRYTYQPLRMIVHGGQGKKCFSCL